jgi:hypothetical protein
MNYVYSRLPNQQDEAIVSFSNADNAWSTHVNAERDATFNVGYRQDGDLGAFLSRPVKIGDVVWNSAVPLSFEIDPWSNFLNNINVLRRLENYYLLRGDLEISIMINGNGFYYGRALAAYNPLKLFRKFDTDPGDPLYNIQASQRPHVFLDPTTSTGGSLCVPYFWPKNWMNLTERDYGKLGTLSITEINPLRQANSGTGAVNIVIFACMKNVELTIPTVNPVGSVQPESGKEFLVMEELMLAEKQRLKKLRKKYNHAVSRYINARLEFKTALALLELDPLEEGDEFSLEADLSLIRPESGSMKMASNGKGDEYGKGIISKPASIMAKAAGALTNVPGIGSYALASKIALDGVANIARIFGYSRPPIVSNIMPTKLIQGGVMCNVDADEHIVKLSLDTKQELTIDPRTVGLDSVDQMSFAHVLQHESLVTSFDWEEDDDSEDVLFSMNVSPVLFRSTGVWGTNTGRAAMIPMTMVSQMFEHWRGSIILRFQIVASNFHKGRIRVTYDPYATGLFSSTEYNVAYNRIIDLAEERDFEMTINWCQPEAWRTVPVMQGLTVNRLFNAGNLLPLADRTNGMLQVSVLNELTTPNSTVRAPIQINVFARAGPDLEFANPTGGRLEQLTWAPFVAGRSEAITPEAGSEVVASENEVTDTGMSAKADNVPAAGVEHINDVGGTAISPSDDTLYVYMGEKVTSLRSLMKRYVFHDIYDVPGGALPLIYFRQFARNFPDLRGYADVSRLSGTGSPYNFVHMTYLNWITPCYLGWRGGIRRKVHHVGLDERTVLNVSRYSNAITANQQIDEFQVYSNKIDTVLARQFRNTTDNGRGGSALVHAAVGGCIEYELPFYSEYRFCHTHDLGNDVTLTNKPKGLFHALECWTQFNNSNDTQGLLRTSVAAGEDFSCFWFINVPTCYSYIDEVA